MPKLGDKSEISLSELSLETLLATPRVRLSRLKELLGAGGAALLVDVTQMADNRLTYTGIRIDQDHPQAQAAFRTLRPQINWIGGEKNLFEHLCGKNAYISTLAENLPAQARTKS